MKNVTARSTRATRKGARFLAIATMAMIINSCFVSSASAVKVGFDTGMPSGWVHDTSNRPKRNDTLFQVKFRSQNVSFASGKVKCTSSDYNRENEVKYGGGVDSKDYLWTRGNMKARCKMGSDTKAIARTQASFWTFGTLIGASTGDKMTEIDVFECKGGNRISGNHLTWEQTASGGARVSPDAGGDSKRGEFYDERGNSTNPEVAFNALRNWKVWRVNNKTNGQAKFYEDSNLKVTLNGVRTATKPQKIIVHNKPWRFTRQLEVGNGPCAPLECDWVVYTN